METRNTSIVSRFKDVARRFYAPATPETVVTPRNRLTIDRFLVTHVAGEDELLDVRLAVFGFVAASDPACQPVERLLGVYEERNVYVERQGKTGRPMPAIFEGIEFEFDRPLAAVRFVVNVQSVEAGAEPGWNNPGFTEWRVREVSREVDGLSVGSHAFTATRHDTSNAQETHRNDGNFELAYTVVRIAQAAAA